MAGSLTLRITQTDPDETRHMPIEDFVLALKLILNGRHTQGEIETFFNMTASDITQFGQLLILIAAGGANMATKFIRVEHIRSILAIWEMSPPLTPYNTEDKIETELSGIDNYPI